VLSGVSEGNPPLRRRDSEICRGVFCWSERVVSRTVSRVLKLLSECSVYVVKVFFITYLIAVIAWAVCKILSPAKIRES
jgi:hypothetical protein